MSNPENPFSFDSYQTMEAGPHAKGFEVVMANADYRVEQLLASVGLMIGRRVAVLAAIVWEMAPELWKEPDDCRDPHGFLLGRRAGREYHERPGQLPPQHR